MLTAGRAQLLWLMDAYGALDYSRTLLEVQKLAYFLQAAGEPLRLKYQTGIYGPYAHNLNKVLEVMEGHFIRGYGDSQKPEAQIELLPGAIAEADAFLVDHEACRPRLQRVAELIEGFETPYGMELLATVHWVAHHGGTDAEQAIAAVHGWNPRKARIFRPEHIRTAWAHLARRNWLEPAAR